MSKVTLELTPECMSNLVRQDLIDCYINPYSEQELRPHLLEVINYYSTPSQWIEFCNKSGIANEKAST